MKKALLAAIGLVLIGCSEAIPTAPAVLKGPSFAVAPAGQNKLQCLQSGDAVCTLKNSGAKGEATLNITGVGAASVYYLKWNGSIYGNRLSSITQLSFSYTGTPVAGSPRFSIPVDTNNDGYTDFFAFASAYYCNDGHGHVDVIKDTTCAIYVSNDPLVSYPNWAAFAAAQPATSTVSLSDYYLFLIADDIGKWTVNSVIIGKSGS